MGKSSSPVQWLDVAMQEFPFQFSISASISFPFPAFPYALQNLQRMESVVSQSVSSQNITQLC